MKHTRNIFVGMAMVALLGGCTQSATETATTTRTTTEVANSVDPQKEALWKTENHDGVEALAAGKFEDAEKHLLTAKETAASFGAKDVRLAGTLVNLAAAYEGQKKLPEASAAAKEAVESFQANAGPDEPATATALALLAKITNQEGKAADACKYYEQSIAIMEKNGNGSSPDAKKVMTEYAAALKESGRTADATAMQAKSDKI